MAECDVAGGGLDFVDVCGFAVVDDEVDAAAVVVGEWSVVGFGFCGSVEWRGADVGKEEAVSGGKVFEAGVLA